MSIKWKLKKQPGDLFFLLHCKRDLSTRSARACFRAQFRVSFSFDVKPIVRSIERRPFFQARTQNTDSSSELARERLLANENKWNLLGLREQFKLEADFDAIIYLAIEWETACRWKREEKQFCGDVERWRFFPTSLCALFSHSFCCPEFRGDPLKL